MVKANVPAEFAWEACSETIAFFSEGRYFSDGSFNEIITQSANDELSFMATMAMGYQGYEEGLDMKQLASHDVASYLWQRFVHPLSFN